MGDVDNVTGEQPITAEEFRKALADTWYYVLADGVKMQLKRVPLRRLVFDGLIPAPVLQMFAERMRTGDEPATDTAKSLEETREAGRVFLMASAVSPRVVADDDKAASDPGVLKISEVPSEVLVGVFRQGMHEQMPFASVKFFRAGELRPAAAARPDGAAVQPAAERVAAADGPGRNAGRARRAIVAGAEH